MTTTGRSEAARRARQFVREAASRRGFEITRNSYSKRLGKLMNLLEIETVLDIGANTGQYADYLRTMGYRGRIISVEPLSDAFATLDEHATQDPAWNVVHAAASDRSGTITINISGNSVSSSKLPMLKTHERADPRSVYVGSEVSRALTVDELIRDFDVDASRSFLKIDVQGYEGVVLDGAALSLHRFVGAALELSLVPLYEGQSLMREIVSRMEHLGFDLWMLEPGFWEFETSRTLQCDGVFVRRGVMAAPPD